MTDIKKKGLKLPAGDSYLTDTSELKPQKFYGIIKDLNTTVEDVLDPIYFGNHANRFQAGGANGFPRITLDWEDGSKSIELTVLGTGNQTVTVVERNFYDYAAAVDVLTENENTGVVGVAEYFVDYKGAGKKHCIIRNKDKAIIKEGFATKGAAIAGLAEFQKAVAA